MSSLIATDSCTALVPSLGFALDVKVFRATLDEGRSPYGEIVLTIATPAEDESELLDPRDELRVEVTLTKDWSTGVHQERTFDMYLHARTIDAGEGETTLTLRTDEAVLIDTMLGGTSVDTSAETHQGSLRAIIDEFLDRFGAELEPGTADADFTITWNATNLLTNPSAEVDTNGWLATSGATLARSTTVAHAGDASFRLTATAASEYFGIFTDTPTIAVPYAIPVQAGKQYRFGMWVYTTHSGKTVRPLIRWATPSADIPGSDSVGVDVPLTPGMWVFAEVIGTAPATATNAGAYPLAVGPWAVGNLVYFDDGIFHEYAGRAAAPFSGATPADSHYTYAWTGTAHASTSTRTRLDNRAEDILQWRPGVKAWDFLSPLMDAAGLRLFCDEQRRWWLVNRPHDIDGQVNLTEAINVTEAADTIDLGESDTGRVGFAETVVVEYRWTDSAGAQHVAYDAAGEPTGIGFHMVVERPYPGPGAAANLLSRAAGKGRTLKLSALSDLATTPGMSVVATLPGIPIQTGRVSAVEWTDEDEMSVDSRGLTDTPAEAWVFAEGEWPDVAGISWDDITGGGL